MMADPEGHVPGDAGLVFAAHNNHDPRCGRSPRVRNTDNPGLYHGYFENRYGEQFVFTFDRATGTGTVSGGDLGWGAPKSFTLGLLDEALRSAERFALPRGLAATEVTVADPAVGTGTFMLGTLRRIAETIGESEGEGAVPGAINAALSRLIAFEIQLGPS